MVKGFKEKNDTTAPFVCKTILIVLLIGIIARLLIGFLVTHVYDVQHWGVVMQNINSGNGLYEITGFFYTPVWGYLLGVGAFFQDLFGVGLVGERITELFVMEDIAWYYTATTTTPTFNFAVKIMFLISDVIVGYFIFWLIRDFTGDHKKAVTGFILWFLCPFVIISGSVIGMFDTISVMMLLLSVIMLRKGRYVESGVMLCMATLVKFFPGFLAFVFLAYIISKHREEGSRKHVSRFLIGLSVTALVIFLPQLLDGTFADCFLFITSRLSSGTGAETLGVVSGYAALLIYILALIVSIYCAIRISRYSGKDLDMELMDTALIIVTVLFLFPPLPQYVLLLLPFLLFAMAFDRRYVTPCILLFIGTTISAIAGGPTDLVSIAVFTDMISLDSLIGIIDGYTSPIFGGSPLILIGYAGSAIQYAGILFVLWVRFGDRIKAAVAERKVSQE
jgi:Protein of unknown function (DUF2029).